jgi:hypothetical protein
VGVEVTSGYGDGQEKITGADILQILVNQRRRLGLSQGDVAKELKYRNVNFISMTESGRSKIPINRITDFIEAYRMSPEFALVILKVQYPEILETVIKLSKTAPRIFKGFIKDPARELANISSKSIH